MFFLCIYYALKVKSSIIVIFHENDNHFNIFFIFNNDGKNIV